MKKVMIIGCPGSGKTTLSHEVSKILKLPLHHLDLVMWRPNWQPAPYQEFLDEQDKILKTDSWVIDGNFTRSIPARIEAADTLVFLDVPPGVCLYRVLKRYFRYFGRNRPDMGGGNKEALKLKQLKFILTYPRAQVYEFLKAAPPGKCIYILKTKSDTHKMLAEMRAATTRKGT